MNPMIKKLFSLLFMAALFPFHLAAQEEAPDTVKVGVYITSIHDIDFRQKEYSINLWLWLNYKNKELDFVQNLEIPQAKSFTKSYSTIDTSDGKVALLMKLQCVMKDSWKIGNFPFDRQRLRLGIENAEFDKESFVFVADTVGVNYDHRFVLSGWKIDSFDISTGTKVYETAFGDESALKPQSEYSVFRVRFGIHRDAWGLFWKIFLGMYVACLIAYVCFYIHGDSIDSRFGLSVGSLFAAIGNKYIIDSSLPESTSFTLVDSLHGLTLLFIFSVITCSAISLRLIKKNKIHVARRFDMIMAQVLLLAFIAINLYLVRHAL
jgi:hypothetical protein